MRGIAYCGLDCSTCDLVDELAGLAGRAAVLKSDIIRMKVPVWAPDVLEGGSSIDFPVLERSLTWMAETLTCPGCQEGGGMQDCPVRLCSRERGFDNCSQCAGLMDCAKFDHLNEPDKVKERLLNLRK